MAGVAIPTPRFLHGVRETADMIMFKHTAFALPFAVISLITAAGDGWPRPWVWGWVAAAMVGARTAAMAFNRLADHHIDATNPRTMDRALPARRLSRGFAWIVTGVAVALFVLAAGMLNSLCLLLSAPTLAVLLGYSYSKRFTSLSHLWLGVALAIAPVGAWIAVTGGLAWPPVALAVGVAAWVAGFDVIYSLQDESFDRARGLHSLPARRGGGPALAVARGLHVVAFGGFFMFTVGAGGGPLRWTAMVAAALLLAWQHRLVRPDDLRAVDAAFFTANGVLALVMCVLFLFAKMPLLS